MGCTNFFFAISARNVAITFKGFVQDGGGGGGHVSCIPPPPPPPPPHLYINP